MRRKFEAHGYIRTCRQRAHDATGAQTAPTHTPTHKSDATHHTTPHKLDASHAQATLDSTHS